MSAAVDLSSLFAHLVYRLGPALGACAQVAGEVAPQPQAAEDAAQGRPGPILVVEPDARLRSLLKVGLARAGFEVVCCRSAWAARRELEPRRPLPSLVIAEAQLPPSDGLGLCEALRADPRTAHVPVLLLAREVTAELQAVASLAGADDLLAKPLFLEDVVTRARLEVEGRGAGGTLEADAAEVPVPQALRALLSGCRAGRLTLAGGAGALAFHQGRLVEARWGTLRGEQALRPLLLLARGRYTVSFGPSAEEGSLELSLRELCRRLLPEALALSRVPAGGPTLEARLVPEFSVLARTWRALPRGVEPVLRLFDGYRPLGRVLLEAPLPAATTLGVARRLTELGVLREEVPAPEAQAARPGTLTLLPRPAPEAEGAQEDAAQLSARLAGLSLAPASTPARCLPA